jgi:exopolysaccharide production protein ExoQ
VILLCFVALLPLYRGLRGRASVVLPALIFGVVVAGTVGLWLAANLDLVLNVLGKDATLTGRTDLWAAVLQQIERYPVLGHGYSAFWLGWSGPSAAVLTAVQWEVPHAHNGFLDLLLDLGGVGLLLFAAGFGVAAVRSVATLRATRTAEGIWPLAFLTFMLFYNLTESAILQQNSVFWVLFVATVVSPMLQAEPAAGTRLRVEAADLPATSALSPGVRRRIALVQRSLPSGSPT